MSPIGAWGRIDLWDLKTSSWLCWPPWRPCPPFEFVDSYTLWPLSAHFSVVKLEALAHFGPSGPHGAQFNMVNLDVFISFGPSATHGDQFTSVKLEVLANYHPSGPLHPLLGPFCAPRGIPAHAASPDRVPSPAHTDRRR